MSSLTLPSHESRPANFTRRSSSFVAKFRREGRYHLIPLYYLLQLSDFGREGVERSGSYRFADYLYRGVPSGKGPIGRLLDRLLLGLPAARSMRRRCFASCDAMHVAFQAHLASGNPEPFRILTVPCGLPRDVCDFAEAVSRENPALLSRLEYVGLDIDPQVVAEARAFLQDSPFRDSPLHVANALERTNFPEEYRPHFVASTGLGEFLDDAELTIFFANLFHLLAPGGTFFTSASAASRSADYLLRAFELDAHYRTEKELAPILQLQRWEALRFTRDASGLQTFILAAKNQTPSPIHAAS